MNLLERNAPAASRLLSTSLQTIVLINDCHRYDASLGLVLFVLVWYDVLGIMMVLMLLLS